MFKICPLAKRRKWERKRGRMREGDRGGRERTRKGGRGREEEDREGERRKQNNLVAVSQPRNSGVEVSWSLRGAPRQVALHSMALLQAQ